MDNKFSIALDESQFWGQYTQSSLRGTKQSVQRILSPELQSLYTVLEALWENPCMVMTIPELLGAIIADDGNATVWGAAGLALRAEEAAPFVERMLRHGAPWQQYSLARTLKDALPERHKPTLMTMATDASVHTQARVGACYALSAIPLDRHSTQRIIAVAQSADADVVRRTALIALSCSNISEHAAAVKEFLNHDDPFTRLHAARLLLENSLAVDYDMLLELAAHSDYLVRQEAYSVLGCLENPRITAFLERTAVVEQNHSAAREARLALRRQHTRSLADTVQQAQAWFTVEDDLERWQGVQYALRQNKAAGMSVLAAMVQESSLLGETSLARLVILLFAGFADTAQQARDCFVPRNDLELVSSLPLDAAAAQSHPDNKHFLQIHSDMADYTVWLHNAQPDTPKISENEAALFAKWVIREDFMVMPANHAYNPLTERGFVRRRGFGGAAHLYVERILQRLDALHGRAHLSDSNHREAWRLIGRVFHVLQDMTSPLHVFSVWHVLNSCHVEVYWAPFTVEARQLVEDYNTQPITPSELAPTSTLRLDTFTRAALEARMLDMPHTLMGYMDALAWNTYYRASFWGEIRYADKGADAQTTPTTYDDGETAALPNVLHGMFDGNIRYHTAWWGDYFEIADRMGNTFSWNRLLALDEWRPCPNPRGRQMIDGHIALDDENGMRVTGRFLFTHRGKSTPYCHPFAYPNGETMESHLPQYYGETLFPVMIAYGGGWFGALAEQYPRLFEGDSATVRSQIEYWNEQGTILERAEDNFGTIRYQFWNEQRTIWERVGIEGNFWETIRLYAPRCGCTP